MGTITSTADTDARVELLAAILRRLSSRVVWTDRPEFDHIIDVERQRLNVARAARGLGHYDGALF